jgi:hypothetical protein
MATVVNPRRTVTGEAGTSTNARYDPVNAKKQRPGTCRRRA